MLQVLAGMIQRKLAIYPADDRSVIDFWFESMEGRPSLQLKSGIAATE